MGDDQKTIVIGIGMYFSKCGDQLLQRGIKIQISLVKRIFFALLGCRLVGLFRISEIFGGMWIVTEITDSAA